MRNRLSALAIWGVSALILFTAACQSEAPLPTLVVLPSQQPATATAQPPTTTSNSPDESVSSPAAQPTAAAATGQSAAATTTEEPTFAATLRPTGTANPLGVSLSPVPTFTKPAPQTLPGLGDAPAPLPTWTSPPQPTAPFTLNVVTPFPTLAPPVQSAAASPIALRGLDEADLGDNLTALQAYDAFVAQFAAQLVGTRWLSLTGSPQVGWTIELAASDQSALFLVRPDGKVTEVPNLLAAPDSLPAPLIREAVRVDSEAAAAAFSPASAQGSLVLRLSLEAGLPVWLIQNTDSADSLRLNAATGAPLD